MLQILFGWKFPGTCSSALQVTGIALVWRVQDQPHCCPGGERSNGSFSKREWSVRCTLLMANAYCWDGLHKICLQLHWFYVRVGDVLELAWHIAAIFWKKQKSQGRSGAGPNLQGLLCKLESLLNTSSLASVPHTVRYPKLVERRCQSKLEFIA